MEQMLEFSSAVLPAPSPYCRVTSGKHGNVGIFKDVRKVVEMGKVMWGNCQDFFILQFCGHTRV